MEVVNAAGKRVSLLNDDATGAASAAGAPGAHGAAKAAALPLHGGPPTPPRPAGLSVTAASGPTLARPELAWKPSYASSHSSSSVTTTSSLSSSSPSSALHHHHHHHHYHQQLHHHTQRPHHYPSQHRSSTSSSRTDPIYSRHNSSASIHSTSHHHSPTSRTVPQLSRHDSTSSSSQGRSTPSPMTPTTFYEPLDQGKSAINGADPSTYPFGAQSLNPLASVANAAFYPSSAQVAMPAAGQGMYAPYPSMQAGLMGDPYGMPVVPAMQYQYATELIDTTTPPAGLGAASLTQPAGLTNGHATSGSDAGSANGSQQKPKKKKYPCPHAARFGCTDTFTTSGHAARHGKKHTGEKNILCPTCNKAFTRKDNMKQHERTHKNRNSNNNNNSSNHHSGNSVDDSSHKVNGGGHSRRTQSISSVAASTLTHKSSGSNAGDMELDSPITDAGFDSKRNSLQRPGLSRPNQYLGSSSGGSASPAINGSGDVKADHPSLRPELNRQFSGESQDGEGESPGLDALAMAATSEFR